MPVYFIQVGDEGPVKIGRATNVKRRLAELQVAHYESLRILREITGEHAVERWFHKKFNHLQLRGEWFQFSPEMLTICPPEPVGNAHVSNFLHEAEDRGKRVGVTVDELCHMAEVNRATWQRWKANKVGPTLKNWQRVTAVLEKLEEVA